MGYYQGRTGDERRRLALSRKKVKTEGEDKDSSVGSLVACQDFVVVVVQTNLNPDDLSKLDISFLTLSVYSLVLRYLISIWSSQEEDFCSVLSVQPSEHSLHSCFISVQTQ